MKNLLVALVSCAILLTGCQKAESPSPSAVASAAPAPQVELQAGLVAAGEGLKEVKVGQDRAEVEKSLGEPSAVDSNEFVKGQTYALYHAKGIELAYQDDKVQAITLHTKDKDWAAYTGAVKEGVGPGSTAEQIVAALGEPDEKTAQALRYPKLGLWFRLNKDQKSKSGPAWAETLSVQAPEL